MAIKYARIGKNSLSNGNPLLKRFTSMLQILRNLKKVVYIDFSFTEFPPPCPPLFLTDV